MLKYFFRRSTSAFICWSLCLEQQKTTKVKRQRKYFDNQLACWRCYFVKEWPTGNNFKQFYFMEWRWSLNVKLILIFNINFILKVYDSIVNSAISEKLLRWFLSPWFASFNEWLCEALETKRRHKVPHAWLSITTVPTARCRHFDWVTLAIQRQLSTPMITHVLSAHDFRIPVTKEALWH